MEYNEQRKRGSRRVGMKSATRPAQPKNKYTRRIAGMRGGQEGHCKISRESVSVGASKLDIDRARDMRVY